MQIMAGRQLLQVAGITTAQAQQQTVTVAAAQELSARQNVLSKVHKEVVASLRRQETTIKAEVVVMPVLQDQQARHTLHRETVAQHQCTAIVTAALTTAVEALVVAATAAAEVLAAVAATAVVAAEVVTQVAAVAEDAKM